MQQVYQLEAVNSENFDDFQLACKLSKYIDCPQTSVVKRIKFFRYFFEIAFCIVWLILELFIFVYRPQYTLLFGLIGTALLFVLTQSMRLITASAKEQENRMYADWLSEHQDELFLFIKHNLTGSEKDAAHDLLKHKCIQVSSLDPRRLVYAVLVQAKICTSKRIDKKIVVYELINEEKLSKILK